MMKKLSEREQVQVDLSLHEMEMKREALTTLVPHPDQIEKRIELIALLRGRRPEMNRLALAKVEQEGWIALGQGRLPDLSTLDTVRFVHTNSTSLDGKRSAQVVEIAKSETHVPEKSILDMLKGKK